MFILILVVFTVASCGGGGEGDSSPAAPPAPTGVTATAGDGEATIGWDNVADATSYNIYYSTTAGVTKVTGSRFTEVSSPNIVTGLTNGTTYYFVVTAVNAVGESVESIQVFAMPTPAPTNVTATAGHGEVTISWPAVTGATSYNIYFDNTTGVTKTKYIDKVTGITTSPIIVTGLVNDTPYYFVVTAVNAAGESVESSQVSATPTPAPPPPPSAPTGVTATADFGEVTIKWSAVTGATSYNIYFDNTTGVTKTKYLDKVTGVTTSPKVVTSLIQGTPYYFVVTAENANGESVESSQVSDTPFVMYVGFGDSITMGGGRMETTTPWTIHLLMGETPAGDMSRS